MTQTDDSTMAASEAAGTAFKRAERKNKSKRLKTAPVERIPVQRTHKYTIRVYFPMPRANTKFNPASSMRLFYKEMLKYDSSITVFNPIDDQQLQLAQDAIPASEAEFKKFFTVTNDTRPTGMKPHIIIGCYMMSERTVHEIKFESTSSTKFLDWLSKEKIFVESDSLGIAKTATVGYLFKLHPHLTNRTFLKPLLLEVLSDIVISPELACELDPTLKTQQTEAMSNGNLFIPEIPSFEIYKTHVSHGRDDKKIETDVIGIKCAIDKSRLLKEFFTQLGNPMELDTRIGTFVPTGAVHLIGQDAYVRLLHDNNSFLQTIATVPIGDFQHATLEIPFSTDTSTDIDATTLYDTILDQPWCLSLERTTTANKVLLITTKGQLANAREWADTYLPAINTQNISDKLDVTILQHLSPQHLDKPVITSASQTYAEKLKLRTSIVTATPTKQNPLNRPPRHRTVKPADISYAEATSKHSERSPPTQSTQQASATQSTQASIANTKPFDYKAALKCISHDVETSLKAKFDAVFANLQKSIDTIDQRVDQKLQTHFTAIQASQADKATQEEHTQQQEEVTKTLNSLVRDIHLLLNDRLHPTPMTGIGKA